MQTGIIKTLRQDKGFGFIASEGRDYFFHVSKLRDLNFESLAYGQKVEFEATKLPDGRTACSVVRPAGAE